MNEARAWAGRPPAALSQGCGFRRWAGHAVRLVCEDRGLDPGSRETRRMLAADGEGLADELRDVIRTLIADDDTAVAAMGDMLAGSDGRDWRLVSQVMAGGWTDPVLARDEVVDWVTTPAAMGAKALEAAVGLLLQEMRGA